MQNNWWDSFQKYNKEPLSVPKVARTRQEGMPRNANFGQMNGVAPWNDLARVLWKLPWLSIWHIGM